MLGFSLSVNKMDTIRSMSMGTDRVQKLGATVREAS